MFSVSTRTVRALERESPAVLLLLLLSLLVEGVMVEVKLKEFLVVRRALPAFYSECALPQLVQ